MSENAQALVVYESMFGNTEQVAEAIGEGLRSKVEAEVVRVDRAPEVLPDSLDLLVVGGPTHAFSMSRPGTRESASAQGTVVMPSQVGIREWLDRLLPDDGTAIFATFDTRVTKVRKLPGSAAKAAAKVLRRRGVGVVAESVSFYVEDSAGPLSEGELDRARAWGASLAARFEPRGTGSTDPAVQPRRAT
ncbi:flavodoxin domain-containing protein [Kribbella sp. VKM Ac-2568]|uniref:flavodoxin family protein n=1 Tax=Kribbella sp. VKM Ac-2568 TaxID=2512219 RepID=UPI0010CEC6DB|nr:flavodoxin domain-containing protein [Kribbella sp. VKM Ac-2568]TCM50562.1 flavodoxin [Kribbella sp. VKM Ac-2568]